ncbi:adrenocorticotropic hormone receptor [Corythoichthys intestinalis]|uniref:adrenocorticotropic hormone receptor n=1 Tax=Corythoichthys intestinalis TaxID=161448 RepID=UPI0025A5F5C4|nr:adrenocorticotropic hormone receptor [Corythoichthys intestinalis]XP_057690320.1 adrenocorticotropic hormone receptor [Corythoichthys intestinalis]XP_057690321.1 adrenocorticotropic hormone receptor [Corythoichthys intestinalis]XP_061789679.1 adrenocorticotropic hormone receptor-like [Nerophis lumbriciformis]
MNTTTNTSDCPELSVPLYVFFTIGLFSLMENLLVVVAVIYNRNLHSPMYFFMCSLAGFNTIASITKTCENILLVFADVGHLEKEGSSETKLDDVIDSLLCMSFVGSIFSFLAIAVDRFVSIFHALRYHNIMTIRRTGTSLGIIWTTCVVSAIFLVNFFHFKFIMICFVALFIIAFVTTCFLYAHIFMLARIHAKKIGTLNSGGAEKSHQRSLGSSMRGALTLTTLFGTFVVCWVPFILHLVILTVCPKNPYCECFRSLFQLHVILLMSHALIDPAIYAFRSTELRHTFRKMFLCFKEM